MKELMDLFIKQEKQRRINNYEAAWKKALESIKQAVNEQIKLSTIVEAMCENNSRYNGFIPKFLADQVYAIDYGSRYAQVPAPYRLNVLDGIYVSVPKELPNTRLFESIAGHIDSEVDCLVEFGSGLGINLAKMRLLLPEANLCYIACEPSESGRIATQSIFLHDPKAELKTQYFDYLKPDLRFLQEFKKVVVFTCHSIEQIMVLGDEFYNQLLNTNIHACIHCEPIGWQRRPEYYDTVLHLIQNNDILRQFAHSYTFVLDNKNMLANAAAWASMGGYNIDLLTQIRNVADRGDIAITDTAYDYVGSNPFNPSTLISWMRQRK